MVLFHVFKVVEMIPNRAMHHKHIDEKLMFQGIYFSTGSGKRASRVLSDKAESKSLQIITISHYWRHFHQERKPPLPRLTKNNVSV